MKTLQAHWIELLRENSDGISTGYLIRLIESHARCKIFAAIEKPSMKHAVVLSVPKTALSTIDNLPESSAFRCVIADIKGLGDGDAGIVLILDDITFEDLFVLLAKDIIAAAVNAPTPQRAVSAILNTIDHWRRFLFRCGNALLSDEEIRGLIGELIILACLISKYGARTAIAGWSGPSGALHDFVFPDCELEVKTYQEGRGSSIWINDLAQLQPQINPPLYLITIAISQTPDAGFSLPDYVNELKKSVIQDSKALELLMVKLAESGYLEGLAERYSAKQYLIDNINGYRVGSGFPSILQGSVPAEIDKVHYRLRLATLGQWGIDIFSIISSTEKIGGYKCRR
jgi:hypothetical protein